MKLSKRIKADLALLTALLFLASCGFDSAPTNSNLDSNPAVDTDRDGVPNDDESNHGLDPLNPETVAGVPDGQNGSWLSEHPEIAYLILTALASVPTIFTGKKNNPGSVGDASGCSNPVINSGAMKIDQALKVTIDYSATCNGTKITVSIKNLQITEATLLALMMKFDPFSDTITGSDNQKETNNSITVTKATVNETLPTTGKKVEATVTSPKRIPPRQVVGQNPFQLKVRFLKPDASEIGTTFNENSDTTVKYMKTQDITGGAEWQCWERATVIQIRGDVNSKVKEILAADWTARLCS